MTAPTSQALVERIFSVCGIVTKGRRNGIEKVVGNARFPSTQCSSHKLNLFELECLCQCSVHIMPELV